MNGTAESRDGLFATRSGGSVTHITEGVVRSGSHDLTAEQDVSRRASGLRFERTELGDRRPALVSIPEAARMLGISRASAYRYADAGLLPGVRRLGRRVYVVRARLVEFLEPEQDGVAGVEAA